MLGTKLPSIYNSKATRIFSVSLHIYHVKTLRHTVKIAASFSYIKISHGLNVHLNAFLKRSMSVYFSPI